MMCNPLACVLGASYAFLSLSGSLLGLLCFVGILYSGVVDGLEL